MPSKTGIQGEKLRSEMLFQHRISQEKERGEATAGSK